jgi:hypothetical protein
MKEDFDPYYSAQSRRFRNGMIGAAVIIIIGLAIEAAERFF